ncbi:hypothetical protein GY45DRAFT_550500 [Cubamyces sp. BRFM 1775]|nr:hypothetical protein GY45DRAFT_550500 [Cubamyces sp. BRFM 1775]
MTYTAVSSSPHPVCLLSLSCPARETPYIPRRPFYSLVSLGSPDVLAFAISLFFSPPPPLPSYYPVVCFTYVVVAPRIVINASTMQYMEYAKMAGQRPAMPSKGRMLARRSQDRVRSDRQATGACAMVITRMFLRLPTYVQYPGEDLHRSSTAGSCSALGNGSLQDVASSVPRGLLGCGTAGVAIELSPCRPSTKPRKTKTVGGRSLICENTTSYCLSSCPSSGSRGSQSLGTDHRGTCGLAVVSPSTTNTQVPARICPISEYRRRCWRGPCACESPAPYSAAALRAKKRSYDVRPLRCVRDAPDMHVAWC